MECNNNYNKQIDNTSPSEKSRAPFIEIARSHGIKQSFVPSGPLLGNPNPTQSLRAFELHKGDGARRRVPSVAYNMFYKSYQQPSATEGFDTVTRSKFKLDVSGDGELEKYFRERSG
eukprot:jgi/Bigna1/78668/fgenesh1_pg.56_\